MSSCAPPPLCKQWRGPTRVTTCDKAAQRYQNVVLYGNLSKCAFREAVRALILSNYYHFCFAIIQTRTVIG